MRKLLVASQKGGVGKTTTSINLAGATAMAGTRVLLLDADPLSSISTTLKLAEHPQRQSLRQAGIDLPGVLVSDFIPGLDVLSPYEDAGCSDDDLDRLLALIATQAFQSCYGCLVVDTPPFLGASPGQLLATCDQFVIVMRAEAMAYRTLPAFLELVQRQKSPNSIQAIKMRGILLTLPDGEQPGGRWERELRGRLGSRILPDVVPYDEVVSQAQLFGQVVSHSHRPSSVAQSYHTLVEKLELAAEVHQIPARCTAIEALLFASESLKLAKPASLPPVEMPVAPPLAPEALPKILLEPTLPLELPRMHVEMMPETMPEMEVIPEPIRRRLTPVLPLPAIKPSAILDSPNTPAKQTNPLSGSIPRSPVERRSLEAPEVETLSTPVAPPPAPALVPTPADPRTARFPLGMGLLWVGVAMILGIGLRFLQLPDYLVPVVVGIGVAAVVILAMLFLMPRQETIPDPQPTPVPTPEPRPVKRAASRLSTFTRRPTTSAGRRRDEQ